MRGRGACGGGEQVALRRMRSVKGRVVWWKCWGMERVRHGLDGVCLMAGGAAQGTWAQETPVQPAHCPPTLFSISC